MSLLTQWEEIKLSLNKALLFTNLILHQTDIPYRELEYVQSNGYQYLDTGIVPNNHYIEIQAQFTSTDNNRVLLGYNSNDFHITWYSGQWYYVSNGSELSGGSSFPCTQLNTFIYGKNKVFTINGNVVNSSCNASSNNNLWLLRRPGNTVATPARAKIYYFKIYNRTTNVLVRDFIPVLDDNDVACLYDKVSHNLFYSTGSQQFAAGPILG